MTAYMLGAIDIHDPEGYAKYRTGTAAAMAAFDIEILSLDDQPDILEGVQPAGHLFLIKFRSVEDIHAFHKSELYHNIIHHRHASSTARYLMAMRGFESSPK